VRLVSPRIQERVGGKASHSRDFVKLTLGRFELVFEFDLRLAHLAQRLLHVDKLDKCESCIQSGLTRARRARMKGGK
jgi:hypothetical protein